LLTDDATDYGKKELIIGLIGRPKLNDVMKGSPGAPPIHKHVTGIFAPGDVLQNSVRQGHRVRRVWTGIRTALVNSFGFGGVNAVLVLQKRRD